MDKAPIFLSMCQDAIVKKVSDCSKDTLKELKESKYWYSRLIQFEFTIHDNEIADFIAFLEECHLVVHRVNFTFPSEEIHNLIKVLTSPKHNYLAQRLYEVLFSG